MRSFRMIREDQCPLAQVSCCREVPEYHDPVPARGGPLRPGEILDGRFRITEVLSRSSSTTVYKAEDQYHCGRLVAVKVLCSGYESQREFLAQFEREEAIGFELDHPFVLKYLRVTGAKSRPYVVTEYLRGCTMSHLLKAMAPFPESDALKIASLLCEALTYMHGHGIIHRDLKPQNVMICCDRTIRVMDFGISRRVVATGSTQHGFLSAVGTPEYMAPEQVKGGRCDARTDIYSLGVLLYEMLTGVPPFTNQNAWAAALARVKVDPPAPRQLNPVLSAQAEEIVLRAMRREPKFRFQSAITMKAALDRPDQVPVTGLAGRLQTRPDRKSESFLKLLKTVFARFVGKFPAERSAPICDYSDAV